MCCGQNRTTEAFTHACKVETHKAKNKKPHMCRNTPTHITLVSYSHTISPFSLRAEHESSLGFCLNQHLIKVRERETYMLNAPAGRHWGVGHIFLSSELFFTNCFSFESGSTDVINLSTYVTVWLTVFLWSVCLMPACKPHFLWDRTEVEVAGFQGLCASQYGITGMVECLLRVHSHHYFTLTPQNNSKKRERNILNT